MKKEIYLIKVRHEHLSTGHIVHDTLWAVETLEAAINDVARYNKEAKEEETQRAKENRLSFRRRYYTEKIYLFDE